MNLLRKLVGVLAISLLVFASLSGVARASLIEISYTGSVTSVDAPLGGTFSVADLVTGVLRFEAAAPLTSSDSTRATYATSLQSFSLTIGSYTATATGGTVLVDDNHQAGSAAPFVDGVFFLGLDGLSGSLVGGLAVERLQFSIFTEVLTTLTSLNLPSVADLNAVWNVNTADGNTNFLQFADSNEVRYSLAGFTAAEVNAVPEPGSLALLFVGSAVLLFFARRRPARVAAK